MQTMPSLLLLMLEYIFTILSIIFLILFFLSKKNRIADKPKLDEAPKQQKVIEKKKLGQIQVLYASQTGTAAKMAANFAEEASEHGFEGVVINLKDITHDQFKRNQISVFFMANTGQGEPPQNSVQFMKMLRGKVELQGQKPNWEHINYAVFGLGDTQYEHFNKIGIDTDTLIEKLGGQRLAKIGLGDANSSMQDDYIEWKNNLWPVLINFRQTNPYEGQVILRKKSTHIVQQENIEYLGQLVPLYANYRFFIQKKKKQKQVIQSQLDFKTKASLLGKPSLVDKIQERRMNTKYGSSLQLQVHIQGQPEYQTAANIALWPINDPILVQDIIKYFNLNPESYLDIQTIDAKKNNKFNFIAPLTVKQLLSQFIDLQFRVTKGLLKKLSKFQSRQPQYFLTNSSPKTTDQYKRISDKQFYYLFKLIKEYEVKLAFEDFIQLSDSIGPRLFTIASSWKVQKNVVVIASIVKDGLISKHFQRNPKNIKAQLRKSSFRSIQAWKKVIFIGAGTGFAPFRGYLQQKSLAQKENKKFPIITLYFGCKESNSDFIYKQQVLQWEKEGVINRLHLAFSRENQKKVYVQNLLQAEQEQLYQFINDDETGMYICGSTSMGRDVVEVIEKNSKMSNQEFKGLLAKWQQSGKLIKQLW